MRTLTAVAAVITIVACSKQHPAPPADESAPSGSETVAADEAPAESSATDVPPAGPASGPATPQSAEGAESVLGPVASADAKGFTAAGMPTSARFEDQQEWKQPVQIDPGACYAVVAHGSVPVYDIHLVIAMPAMPPLTVLSRHVDTAHGVAGGTADSCCKSPYPEAIPGTLVIRAREGTGYVAARLYRR
jgi:hypothetical protein